MAVLLIAATGAPAWASPATDFLITSQEEIDASVAKAKRCDWAGKILKNILDAAGEMLKRPVNLPNRGGQWGSWYSCPKDGVRLETLSPTRHRCPLCGAVYTGYPYDDVVISQIHAEYYSGAQDCAFAYRVNGGAVFARKAAEILVAYADKYNSYPRHDQYGKDAEGGGRVTSQTLNESQFLISIVWTYSMIRDTLTVGQCAHIEKDLIRAAAELIRGHKMGIHNIQCWKNTAVGLAGFVLGDQNLIHDAIDDPERGFRAQIAQGVTDDGLWYEGSLGYHNYTLSALWYLAEAARRHGIDLYTSRYRSLFDAPIRLSFPNGESPGFNDGGGINLRAFAPAYELAYARWHDPLYGHLLAASNRDSIQALLYGADTVPAGPLVPEESVLFPAAGFAMLRKAGTCAAMRFGLHGGGHGHRDKLNLVTFSGGEMFGLDPTSINYGVPLYFEWYRATIAHNTVTVDFKQQAAVDGQLESWNDSGSQTSLAARADNVYSGVKLRRAVTVTEGRVVDKFSCSSDTPHTYDWAFHSLGRISSSLHFQPQTAPLGAAEGYQHITEVGAARTDEDWWVEWDTGSVRCRIQMKGEPGTEVYRGIGPGRDPRDRVGMVVVRRAGKATVFDAVHQFTR